MPRCFSLTKIGESEPASLVTVDEEIAKFMNLPPHPTEWCLGWYDCIGLRLVIGGTFDSIIEEFTKEAEYTAPAEYQVWANQMVTITKFLKENYTYEFK